MLAELETAPPALIVKGDLGSARPAGGRDGRRAQRLGRRLPLRPPARAASWARRARSIVSGLARGIDTAAHDGALDTGTIAVIAGGIDIVYPPENEARQRAIAERGLLVAEQPPGTEPRARHFPYRNRIIAGLAARHGGGRGGAQIGLADHRALRRRVSAAR